MVLSPRPQGELENAGRVLSKAVIKAAQILQISNAVLSQVLGVSEATVSRMAREQYLLEQGTKPYELAQLFVRLFRSLGAVTGSDDVSSRSWLTNANAALRARPIDLIQTIEGLTRTLSYVDSRRAPI